MKLIFYFTLIALIGVGHVRGQAPLLTLKISNFMPSTVDQAAVTTVSNLKPITLEITLDSKGVSTVPLSACMVNPPGALPSNYLLVRLSNTSDGTEQSVTVTKTQVTSGPTLQTLTVQMQVPEDSQTRSRKLQALINKVKAKEAANHAITQEQLDFITSNNTLALAGLDAAYVENRVGNFRLLVEYHSTQSGSWRGSVTSPFAPLKIVYCGDNSQDLLSGF